MFKLRKGGKGQGILFISQGGEECEKNTLAGARHVTKVEPLSPRSWGIFVICKIF